MKAQTFSPMSRGGNLRTAFMVTEQDTYSGQATHGTT